MITSYKLVMYAFNNLSLPSYFSKKPFKLYQISLFFSSKFLVDTHIFNWLIEIWLESTKNQLIY